jgi:hypothetical protein
LGKGFLLSSRKALTGEIGEREAIWEKVFSDEISGMREGWQEADGRKMREA